MERKLTTHHTLLPHWAQDLLVSASKIENTDKHPRNRDAAIDDAIKTVMKRVPHAFRKEARDALI